MLFEFVLGSAEPSETTFLFIDFFIFSFYCFFFFLLVKNVSSLPYLIYLIQFFNALLMNPKTSINVAPKAAYCSYNGFVKLQFIHVGK